MFGKHTAEQGGRRVEFHSAARKGSWQLMSAAIQALKAAGAYEYGEEIRIDGKEFVETRWE